MNRTISKLMAVIIIFATTAINLNAKESLTETAATSISGKVIDQETRMPVEYASIAIYSAKDSTLVTGTITDIDGNFKITGLNPGEYYIQVNFVGFEKKETEKISISSRRLTVNVGEIGLKPASLELEGVIVAAERSRVECKIDKRVINVDKDLTAKGGTAATALENTPSVQVDPQGNVTLRGSSDFIVLIDGKPSVLKGSDALKQIPAAAVKQIEVITNPSAKYESDGQAGIINVIMQKDKMLGLNGNVSLAYGNTHKRTGNILLNYRVKKVNFFGGVDLSDNNFESSLDMNNRTMLNNDTIKFLQSGLQFNQNYNLSFKGGVDIDINDKNSMSFSGNLGNQSYDRGVNSDIHNWNISYSTDNYSTSRNLNDVSGFVTGANADFTHKFKENHNISISGTFFSWDGSDKNSLNHMFTDDNFVETTIASKLKYQKDDYNFNYRVNLDYKQPIKQGTLEAGAQFRYEDRDEDYFFQNYDVNTDSWSINTDYTYNLQYRNSIYSGYATYSNKIWDIGYQVGARTEYFDREIKNSNSTEPIVYSKFMLYPSVHLSKEINKKHQLQLSYSRRINRPMPFLLNDIPQYVDPNNIFMGSPYMKPEFTDAYEFNYRVVLSKVTISAQSYYRNTTNVFTPIRTMRNDGIMIHQLTNANQQVAFGEEIGLDFKIAKWWQLSTGANIYHFKLNTLVNSTENEKETNTWDARVVSNFNLKWGTRIQAVGYYRAASVDANGDVSGFYVANLAVNQPIMKGKGSIGVSVRNIFDSVKLNINFDSPTFDNNYTVRGEGPVVMLNFSYRFNNFQNKNRGRADDASFKGGGAF